VKCGAEKRNVSDVAAAAASRGQYMCLAWTTPKMSCALIASERAITSSPNRRPTER
jgi:hypothetical protein